MTDVRAKPGLLWSSIPEDADFPQISFVMKPAYFRCLLTALVI